MRRPAVVVLTLVVGLAVLFAASPALANTGYSNEFTLDLRTGQIVISGDSSLQVGFLGRYRASATGCSPQWDGWTWDFGGGIGSWFRDSASASWNSTGWRVVTAKNSACGSATGTFNVTVTPMPGPVRIFVSRFFSRAGGLKYGRLPSAISCAII